MTRLVEMGSILCYGFNSCSESYLRSRNNDVYCTGDRSCHIATKIVAEENIYCNGNRGCDLCVGDIESENGNVFCNGFKGCYKANSDISAYKNVACDGDYGCYSADGFITAATGHVSCQGEQSCYDVTGLISAQTDITAGGYYSAAMSEMNAESVYCEGEMSCYDSNIEASTIDCSGQESCYEATMEASEEIVFVGGHSGTSSTISAASTYGYGAYSLSFADIDSAGIEEMYVYLYGYYAGEYADIYCRSGSQCIIECAGNACYETTIYYWSGADVIIEPVACKYGAEEATEDGVSCPELDLVAANSTEDLLNDVRFRTRQRERKRSTEWEQLTAKITAKNEQLKVNMAELEEHEVQRENLEQQLAIEGNFMMETRKDHGVIRSVMHQFDALPVSATLSIGALVGTVTALTASVCWKRARSDKIKYQPLK